VGLSFERGALFEPGWTEKSPDGVGSRGGGAKSISQRQGSNDSVEAEKQFLGSKPAEQSSSQMLRYSAPLLPPCSVDWLRREQASLLCVDERERGQATSLSREWLLQ
jgi:hypothetical protein